MNVNVQLFSAESLLKDAPILAQINQIKQSLNYQTEDGLVSVTDYFNLLKRDIGNLKSFDLNSSIAPGTEYAYILTVTNSLQDTLDQLEQVSVKAVFFQSRLKSIQKNIDNAGATFSAWYQIALAQALKASDIKIPISAIKSLGDSEFSRLMEGQDLDIEAMIQSVEIHLGMLKSHKNLAQEKYKMAKDQVNASISNLAPVSEYGNEDMRLPRYQKLQEKYGDHFKANPKPVVPEEEVDDEPVIYNSKKGGDDEPLLTGSVIEDTFSEQMADPNQDVVFDEEEDMFTPAVEFEISHETGNPTGIVKRSIQEVTPVVVGEVDDPFLGKVKVEDSKVTKTEGKNTGTTITSEDDDEPVLFKRIRKEQSDPRFVDVSIVSNPIDPATRVSESKDVVLEVPVVSGVNKNRDSFDDVDFPAITQAQKQFQVKQVEKPAKNINPKPAFNDDDLEDIM